MPHWLIKSGLHRIISCLPDQLQSDVFSAPVGIPTGAPVQLRVEVDFERAEVSDRITIKTGDALELLSEEKHHFDVIFNDVDKEDYPRVFRLALPKLRKGGLFITDNVLWSGKVAEKHPKEGSTKAILEFNRLLYNSPDLFTTILPIRDGVAVAIKK